MSQKSHCTQATMYNCKYFYFKTEIKTKVDLYMPCEAMAHSPKSNFYFYFWSAIVRTYERLQVKFLFLFLECNRSYVRTIASQIFYFYFCSAIVRTYERLQVKFLFLFLECNRSYVRTIASQIFIFISGVQSFARTNDCKPNFFILFLECNRSHVRTIASQIFLFHFWSAIVRTYERL